MMKVNVEHLGHNNPVQDPKLRKSAVKTAMDVWWKAFLLLFLKHPLLFWQHFFWVCGPEQGYCDRGVRSRLSL